MSQKESRYQTRHQTRHQALHFSIEELRLSCKGCRSSISKAQGTYQLLAAFSIQPVRALDCCGGLRQYIKAESQPRNRQRGCIVKETDREDAMEIGECFRDA
jgi:hypothetical protein